MLHIPSNEQQCMAMTNKNNMINNIERQRIWQPFYKMKYTEKYGILCTNVHCIENKDSLMLLNATIADCPKKAHMAPIIVFVHFIFRIVVCQFQNDCYRIYMHPHPHILHSFTLHCNNIVHCLCEMNSPCEKIQIKIVCETWWNMVTAGTVKEFDEGN